MSTARDYGEAVCKQHDDGTITVEHADDVIGVSTELLASISPGHISDDGMLVLDTAGEYRYLPVRFDKAARIVVCKRHRPDDDSAVELTFARGGVISPSEVKSWLDFTDGDDGAVPSA